VARAARGVVVRGRWGLASRRCCSSRRPCCVVVQAVLPPAPQPSSAAHRTAPRTAPHRTQAPHAPCGPLAAAACRHQTPSAAAPGSAGGA
jgi:hypothetical protein